jgi:hypothetical protein
MTVTGSGTSTDDIPVYANPSTALGLAISVTPQGTIYTDSTGHAQFNVNVSGADQAYPGSSQVPNGTAEFRVATQQTGSTLTITGFNVCQFVRLSPPDPRCGGP